MQLSLNLPLNFDKLREVLVGECKTRSRKYVSPLINLANRFAGATRPKVVGQVSELFKICPYKNFEGWKNWYLQNHPKSIDEATDKIMNMLNNFKIVLGQIDRNMVKEWVEDLVLVKTFLGLMVQEPILAIFANELKMKYRLATPEDEAKGVDGYIGEYAISIKPESYSEKIALAGEKPSGDVIIFYRKEHDKILITEVVGHTPKGDEFLEMLKREIKKF